MSKTPPKIHDYQVPLGDSWVDLAGSRTPGRITPLPSITTDEYIRMLKEAQRESNPSSARVSLASNSIRNTPWESSTVIGSGIGADERTSSL
ncbi:unnamed protein product [Cyprideis torosa]|uniref:Uncharacterized protein n=1 Tax=Cyprideis torosa TaxID=163714 RepID=A0A7R8WJW2_9CRUS|nr:unnamed protein product [Cyprideis torosa]CAG0895420.1 unnamed protein product [Cyprideis torosa]